MFTIVAAVLFIVPMILGLVKLLTYRGSMQERLDNFIKR